MPENPKPSASTPNVTSAAGQPKQPYAVPALKVYGTVETLTRGQGPSRSSQTPDVIGSFSGTACSSDRRVKQSIVRIGTHPLGIGLYLFEYLPQLRDALGHGRRFGVMADEVEQVLPQAVGTHALGHMTVDYAMLGIRLH